MSDQMRFEVGDLLPPVRCSRVRLISVAGEELRGECDTKRCRECGPRKRHLLWASIRQAFGDVAWIGRVSEREHTGSEWVATGNLGRMASRARQRRRRGEVIEYAAIPAGDPGEWIVFATEAITPELRRMEVKPWLARVFRGYWTSTDRVRRSAAVSRVRLSVSRAKRDTYRGRVIIKRRWWHPSQAIERLSELAEVTRTPLTPSPLGGSP